MNQNSEPNQPSHSSADDSATRAASADEGSAARAASGEQKPAIKIFGIGNAGISMLQRLVDGGFHGVEFIAVNTDPASLLGSSATQKIHLETKVLRGMGTGGDPELGRA